MTSAWQPKPSRIKIRLHRERLREQGLRPLQIWVPDVRAPSFRSEARRQSLAVAASARAPEDQAFIGAISGRDEERHGAIFGLSPRQGRCGQCPAPQSGHARLSRSGDIAANKAGRLIHRLIFG